MRNELISFLIGLVIGAGAAYLALKEHFEQIANEEIEDVKRVYGNASNDNEDEKPEPEDDQELQDLIAFYKDPSYKESINMTQYDKIKNENTTEDILVKEVHPSDDDSQAIYLIEDTDFLQPGERYDQKTLTYYVDEGILIDEQYNELFDEMSWLDHGILDAFVESDDDVIYMRNADVMMDFEIVKEHGHWDG